MPTFRYDVALTLLLFSTFAFGCKVYLLRLLSPGTSFLFSSVSLSTIVAYEEALPASSKDYKALLVEADNVGVLDDTC